MSISQFMASGAALAATANNQVLVNNAAMEGAFFDQFSETISASLEATNSAAQDTQEYLTDQGKSQEAQAIGGIIGGATGIAAAFGGLVVESFSSSEQTTEDDVLDATIAPSKIDSSGDEVANLGGSISSDAEENVIPEDGAATVSGTDTDQAASNTLRIAKNEEEEQDTTDTVNKKLEAKTDSTKGTTSKSPSFLRQLLNQAGAGQNPQMISSSLSSVGGIAQAHYTLASAAPQADAGLFTGIAQALNSNTGVITSALQARDSSSANMEQLNSTLIHASGGIAG